MGSNITTPESGIYVYLPETPTFSLFESKAGGRLRRIGADAPSVGDASLGPNVLRAANGFRCGPNMSNGGTWTNFRGDTCGIDLSKLVGQGASAMRMMKPPSTESVTPKSKPGGIGGLVLSGGYPLTERMLTEASNTFINVHVPDSFSGHKAHIYAEDVEGVIEILERLREKTGGDNPSGWGLKVATDRFHSLTQGDHPQRGKGVVVYFPRRDDVEADKKALIELMEGLPSRQQKPIANEEYLGNGVSTRFEFRSDPGRDVNYREYHELYKAASATPTSTTRKPVTEALPKPSAPPRAKGPQRSLPKTRFASQISDFRSTAAKRIGGDQPYVRVRFSADSLLPEALSDESPKKRMEKLKALKPSTFLSRSKSNRVRSKKASDLDRADDAYIRSLGTSVLREVIEEVPNIEAALGAMDRGERERQFAAIEMEMASELGTVSDVLEAAGKRSGLGMKERVSYSTTSRPISDNDHGFKAEEPVGLLSGTRRRLKEMLGTDASVDVGEVNYSYTSAKQGSRLEVKIQTVIGPEAKDYKPLISFRRVNDDGSVEAIDLANIDESDPDQVAARSIGEILDKPYAGSTTRERVANLGKLNFDAVELGNVVVEGARTPETQDAIRSVIREKLESHGVVFGSIDRDEILFESKKYGTPVKKTDKAIVVSAASGALSPEEQEEVARSIEEVLAFMPSDWAESLKSMGINIAFAKRGKSYRAQAEQMDDGSYVLSFPHYWTANEHDMMNREDFRSWLLHEMVHAVQSQNAELSEAEFIHFLTRAEGDLKGRLLRDITGSTNYLDDEFAVADDLDDAYMFKIYQYSHHSNNDMSVSEVSAMLMQVLDGRHGSFAGDLDAVAWMLGMIIAQGSS